MSGGSWQLERFTGSADEFHARPLPEPAIRTAWVFCVSRPALVLGSAEPADHVDADAAARAGVEVVRRRSGGGAVLLQPGAVVWIDLIVPRDDPLWDDDVNRATWWVGELWAGVLRRRGLSAGVHRAGLDRAPWSDRACFAGVGAGEVSVDGRKVVGISQRRTRAMARFQCAALLRWQPAGLVNLLALMDSERAECLVAITPRAAGLVDLLGAGASPSAAELVEELLAELPPG